jgi:hypothetical protein
MTYLTILFKDIYSCLQSSGHLDTILGIANYLRNLDPLALSQLSCLHQNTPIRLLLLQIQVSLHSPWLR